MSLAGVDPEGRLIPDASWPPRKQAPGRLERVRRFLNTTNLESGADHLHEPDRAEVWLRAEGWSFPIDDDQLTRLRQFREALRDVVSSAGTPVSWAALLPESAKLAVVLGSEGPVLAGTGYGADLVVSDLLAVVVEARGAGSWARLRTCTNGHCRWAYYDRSRSRTGRWCSMHACGQRQKMRRYRAQQRAPSRVRA